jgi:hypothetical protein
VIMGHGVRLRSRPSGRKRDGFLDRREATKMMVSRKRNGAYRWLRKVPEAHFAGRYHHEYQHAYRSIGHSVAASSTPMTMLNHFSRAGSDRKPRSAVPKPVHVETLGRLTIAKAIEISATDRNG